MERLGRSDAVDDLQAEALLETIKQGRRQRFAGRHGDAKARQIEIRPSLPRVREQHAVARRHRIEQRRTMALDHVVDAWPASAAPARESSWRPTASGKYSALPRP